jgi:hypothetical protein
MQALGEAMMRRSGALLLLGLAAAGCEAPTAPGDRGLLAEARARWQAQAGDSYTFELSRGCFCVLGGRQMRVTVKGGVVTWAEDLDSGAAVEQDLLSYLQTIPDLFDLIQDALDRKVASFWVEYDPTYGYPTLIQIDYSATATDDEIAYTVQGLVFIENTTP